VLLQIGGGLFLFCYLIFFDILVCFYNEFF